MKQLNFRIATEQDIPFISEVYLENIAALHGAPRSREVWRELLSQNDTIYYIVYDSVPVAWFRIDLPGDGLWLGMLQVKPAFQREGIGKWILSVVAHMAKEKALTTIGIHTTEDNTAAQALYRSAGYTLTETGPCTTADGIERIGYTFQKKINL